MARNPDRKLKLRIVPADAPPDPQVLDDLIRLIRQGIATAPKEYPQLSVDSQFRSLSPDEQRDLGTAEAQIKHRIEQVSKDSQAAVERRAEMAKQPDGPERIAEECRQAAAAVVAAVQAALLRGVKVTVPESESQPDAPR